MISEKPTRIYQLAKKLNISHLDIITFLSKNGIDATINTVLDEARLDLVLSHFAEDVKKSQNEYQIKSAQKKAEEEERLKAEAQKKAEDEARLKAEHERLRELKETKEKEKKEEDLEKIEIERQKEEERKAKEIEKKILKEKEERLKAEAEAKKELEKEQQKTAEKISSEQEEVSSTQKTETEKKESAKKKKKHKKREDVLTEEDEYDKKLEDLKRRHKSATKRYQVTGFESRLDELKKKRNFSVVEPETRNNKGRKKGRKVDQNEVDKSIKTTLAALDERKTRRKHKHVQSVSESNIEEEKNVIEVTEFIRVQELANHLDVPSNEIIAKAMELGLMLTINQRLDWDTIEILCSEFDIEAKKLEEYTEEILKETEEEIDEKDLEERAPVVTVMGHVDHGKTSILDVIRHSRIAEKESGGITQHIGAYSVTTSNGKRITFLDTPGHEAFTAMRARGAQVTDIVVLVVAADDGVMPQTIEAISHAKAAGVPIIVAINKIDKPEADPERVIRELAEHNVLVEEWGGKVQCVKVSAKQNLNIDKLLEAILLEAEVLELKSTKKGLARGIVIESRLDKGLGPVATVLIQRGTLRVGNPFLCGRFSGKVRAMINDQGIRIKEAYPSDPVQIQGFDDVPQAGDHFICMEDEREVKRIAAERQRIYREQEFRAYSLQTLDEIGRQIKDGRTKELALIIKGDADGSIEALADAFMKLSTKEVAVKVIHKGIGMINETDVNLAAASRAVIIGFYVNATPKALETAKELNVEIRNYTIIYDAVDDVKAALEGLLEPHKTRDVLGKAEVRQIIKISKIGTIAGS
ncbi:MAG: translation initiation factor IF-2, partial [Candidatus Marinimicrobia bacterium]|nr:translation initiation factor IF-2 [Candidatus Neomarinimicrobiota bacterium]